MWQQIGRIPILSTAGPISFYPYSSPLQSEALFSARKRSIEEFGWAQRQVPGSRTVFKAKSAPARIWALAEGEARLIFPLDGCTPGYSRYTAQFELAGLTEALAGIPYSATLRTVSPCRFFCIQRAEIIELLRMYPLLREQLMQTLASVLV